MVAARALELAVGSGEFVSFLGPSGCGKTTALRLVAGFEQPSEGQVILDGEVVNDVAAHRRPVNMVFQSYALFPHMTVAANVGYGLRQRRPRLPAAEIAARVDEVLATVRLEGLAERRIWEISGGQQQRVALARALVNRPKVLLLDEPLAALDRKLRAEMQLELQTLQRAFGITFVLVTHDQEEALSMSDRVFVMRAGAVVQAGTPIELYDRPASVYVADFVGKSNFFAARIAATAASSVTAELGNGQRVPAIDHTGRLGPAGGAVTIAVRPERLVVAAADGALAPGAIRLGRGRVRNRIFLGETTEFLIRDDTLGEVLALVPRHAAGHADLPGIDEAITFGWLADAALALPPDPDLAPSPWRKP